MDTPDTASTQEPGGPARARRVFLVTPDETLQDMLEGLFLPFEVRWQCFATARDALEVLFIDPPDLLIVDNAVQDVPGQRLVGMVKGENVYRHTPVILVLDPEDLDHGPDWEAVEADDFLVRQPDLPMPGAGMPGASGAGPQSPILPLEPVEAASRMVLTLSRARRTQDTNPLTNLPGNTTIMQTVQGRIDAGDEFALCYADLDHFKAFNDKYGFARGDEVLRMAARLMVNTVRAVAGRSGFAGHVGGDDFVFVVPGELAEPACQRFIAGFDSIVQGFYDADDRARGCIESKDRKGNKQTFPFMAVSIAVVLNHGGKLAHYGEASSIASGLKKKAKAEAGSVYVLDRRRS